MHAVWTLPTNDTAFSTRWGLIKSGFSRASPKIEYQSEVRIAAYERGSLATAFFGSMQYETKLILSGISIMSMLIR